MNKIADLKEDKRLGGDRIKDKVKKDKVTKYTKDQITKIIWNKVIA